VTANESNLIRNLNDYTLIPDKKILEKIDYYITPYNRKLVYNKYMDFEHDYGNLNLKLKFSSGNHRNHGR
jgi:hypothetical protein